MQTYHLTDAPLKVYGIPFFEETGKLVRLPDELIEPGDVLTFGNTKVEVYDAGGHTIGTVAYRFMLPGGLKAAMHGGVGVNTLSSAYSKKKGLGTTWRDAFIKNVRALRGLEVDIVLGNHPEQSKTFQKMERLHEATNPFIDRKEWDRMLDACQQKYQRLQEKDPIV